MDGPGGPLERAALQVSTRALAGAKSGYNGRVRAAAYVRVSDDGKTCEHQREAIRLAASARGDEIGAWFEDREPSQQRDGPQLAQLRLAIAGGGVTRLYVFALDRLTRQGIGPFFRHLEHLRLYRCELISLAEGFDFGGPAGDVLAAVFAWVAQQERRRLKQRMASARNLAEKQGKRWGRPRRVDPTTLAAAKKLRDVDKLSLRIIAARLKVPKATLIRALHGKGHYASKKAGG